MSNLYDEAIADARALKEMAERNARNKIIESITPRIRKLIERQILAEQDDEEIPNMDLDTPEDDADVEIPDPAGMPPAPMPDMSAMPPGGLPSPAGVTPDNGEEVTHTVTTKTASGTEVKINVRVDKHGEASATTETGTVDDEDEEVTLNKESLNSLADMLLGERKRNTPSLGQIRRQTESLKRLAKTLPLSERTNFQAAYSILVKNTHKFRNHVISNGGSPAIRRNFNRIVKEISEMSTSTRFRRLVEEMEGKSKLRREAKLVFEPSDLEGLDDEDFKEKLKGMSFGVEFGTEEEPGAGGEMPVDVSGSGAGADASTPAPAAPPSPSEGYDEMEESDYDEMEESDYDEMEESDYDEMEESDYDEMEESDELDETDAEETDEAVFHVDESMLRQELRRLREAKGKRSKGKGSKGGILNAMPGSFGGGSVAGLPTELNKHSKSESATKKVAEKALKVAQEATKAAQGERKARVQEARNNQALKTRLVESEQAISALREQLEEVNLFNAKLLYVNKLMQNRDLSARQQRAVVESLDAAKTVREAKLLYTSLTESLKSKSGSTMNENRVFGSSSRSTRSGSASTLNESVEADRWAILAGINKKGE
jgi:hypothetical protein